MTSFSVERFAFDQTKISEWGQADPRHRNWPVVYVMNNDSHVYVGESINAENRMRQHLESAEKRDLAWVRVVLDERFNKSACLDLESFLIRMFSGDGEYQVLNHNAGITDAEYYDRALYQRTFDEVFEQLRANEHLFTRSIPEIVNSDLFKLSPFKALNHDQAAAVEDILEGLFADLEREVVSNVVVQGNPGTGKTVVAIYLIKLLEDIRRHDPSEVVESDSLFSDFFTSDNAELLATARVGFVIPQQSLRESVARVFALTPGLTKSQVLSPYAVGESAERFDLLIVDEAHRLNQRANQASGPLNKKFAAINERLFGADHVRYTQLDWIEHQADHVILMLDEGQTVKPADLPASTTAGLLSRARAAGRHYPLRSQMRVHADQDYVGYVRAVLSTLPPEQPVMFTGYDLRFFDDLGEMRRAIRVQDEANGLSRLVAGFAWPWLTKRDPDAYDIEIGPERLRWNSTARDWINSPKSPVEVGSIHTVQGYDLNYAGVIIGRDLGYDPVAKQLVFHRSEYFDKKGRENNPKLGITYSDADLLEYVKNIYSVLLTRGIRGTYVYVCDEALREYLRPFFAQA
jgi:DUF2075 family protein